MGGHAAGARVGTSLGDESVDRGPRSRLWYADMHGMGISLAGRRHGGDGAILEPRPYVPFKSRRLRLIVFAEQIV